jgi:hypothetical protein
MSNSPVWRDPIVAEIHEVRRRIWEESGGAIEAFLAYLVRGARPLPGQAVRAKKRRPVRGQGSASRTNRGTTRRRSTGATRGIS